MHSNKKKGSCLKNPLLGFSSSEDFIHDGFFHRWALFLSQTIPSELRVLKLRLVQFFVYRVTNKVPYHPFNYRMAAAIFIRVMYRYGKVTMRYWMKPFTAPPGGKRWS
ncbi:hypothetical protein AVEN_177078-1 [Araneus ventricosus]|uniref:Uncharacterized protein n=1 Tax=Araneus ventricosus TaxID=182803 RepID=A0A4Y2CTC0_ARAVE|nr:hypothetical protein AVEN_177078-1 [Araneus ventricosus]